MALIQSPPDLLLLLLVVVVSTRLGQWKARAEGAVAATPRRRAKKTSCPRRASLVRGLLAGDAAIVGIVVPSVCMCACAVGAREPRGRSIGTRRCAHIATPARRRSPGTWRGGLRGHSDTVTHTRQPIKATKRPRRGSRMPQCAGPGPRLAAAGEGGVVESCWLVGPFCVVVVVVVLVMTASSR